jgi:hypothetical protein
LAPENGKVGGDCETGQLMTCIREAIHQTKSQKNTTHWFSVYYIVIPALSFHSPTRLPMMKLMQSSEAINSNGVFPLVKKQLDGNVRMKDWDAELPAAPNSCYSTSAIVRG